MEILNKKLNAIYEKVNTKQVIIFSIIFVLFTSLVLPFVSVQTTRIIGVSESPDTNFNFHLTHLFNIIDSYGPEGRKFYVFVRWTFDVVWPIIYTLFLGSSIAYFSRRTNCKYNYNFLYVVLLAVLFDLFENINATILMVTYPVESSFIGYLLVISSFLKWILIGSSFAILLLLSIKFIISYSKKSLSS